MHLILKWSHGGTTFFIPVNTRNMSANMKM